MIKEKKKVNLILVFFLSIIYLELIFKIIIFGMANLFNLEIIYSFLFAGIFSIIFAFIARLFHNNVNRRITLGIIAFICSWFAVQFIFKNIFNTFFSVNLFELADQALQFSGTAIMEIVKNIPVLILFFIPYIVSLLMRFNINYHHVVNKKIYFIDIALLILGIIVFNGFLQLNKDDDTSAYILWHNVNNNAINVEKMGVGVSTYLDIKRSLFGFNEPLAIINDNKDDDTDTAENTSKYDYNNLDIDFNELAQNESNKTIKSMDEYFANDNGTLKNSYTGLFKGKNLIVIMGESLNTIAISEKYTPTLYKISHEAFQFNNFYTPVNLSTIGGEFQDLTGLFANLSTLNSKWRSGSNYFPYGLGTVYNNLDYNTYAYHANYGTFQDRNVYLNNLGFNNFLYRGNGLEKLMNCNLWPQSDLDMVNVTYNDWINSDKPFLTYYVSVSGHMPWSWKTNNMSNKNKDALNDSGYSEEAAAYIAANMELDKAVEELINKLSDAGKLDDTVIAIVPDHYPYSMNLSTINELSDFKRDDVIGVNQSSLIIWNNQVKKTEINKVSSQLDFIPTIYNLFGIDYDSRLFMGKDILSTDDGIAYFTDRSWVTNKGKYYASTGQFVVNDGEQISDDYVASMNKIVQNRINISKLIMDNDYYRKILGSD